MITWAFGMGVGAWGGWTIALWLGLYVLFGAFAAVSVLILWPMLIHLGLRITGGTERGLDRTIQAIGYSTGANVVTGIPCVGLYVGWIWWLVSATIMVKTAHGVHGGRAAFAVLAAPVMTVLIILASIYATVLATSTGGAFSGARSPQLRSTMTLTGAVATYGWQTGTGGPEHAIELMLGSNLGMMAAGGGAPNTSPFIQAGTKTTTKDIPVGTGTLADFTKLSRAAQLGEIKTLLEGLPAGIVAHRVGDYVFVYHGASPRDPSLWLVIMLPDPDVNGPPGPDDPVYIGYGMYQVREVTYGALAAELASQNQYRAGLGMPTLPDPVTVTHACPALDPTTGSSSQ